MGNGKMIQVKISDEVAKIFYSRRKGIQAGFIIEEALLHLYNSEKFGPLYFEHKSDSNIKQKVNNIDTNPKPNNIKSEKKEIREW